MTQYAGNPASFPASYTIPDDSAPPTGAQVNVALEALGDRTAYLFARTGGQRIVLENGFAFDDPSDAVGVLTLNANTAQWTSATFAQTRNFPITTIPNLLVNDVIEFEISGNLAQVNASDPCWSRVYVDDGGLLPVEGAKLVRGDIGSTHALPAEISGRYVVTHNGSVTIYLDGKVTNTGAGQVVLWAGAFAIKWRVLRSN